MNKLDKIGLVIHILLFASIIALFWSTASRADETCNGIWDFDLQMCTDIPYAEYELNPEWKEFYMENNETLKEISK